MMAENKMVVMPVGKLIFEMSLPPLFSMFLQYSYNLSDSAFVARLSENALTAVSLSFPITTLMNRGFQEICEREHLCCISGAGAGGGFGQ